jgi:tetratricopeptide (TPR) repeat protein
MKPTRAWVVGVPVKTAAIFLLAGITSACQPTKPTTATQFRNADDEITNPNAPPNANTRLAAGLVAESQGEFDRAISQYQEAAKLDPKLSLPWLRMGLIYTNQKQYDQAIAMWNQYIKVTNGSAAAYCDLGLTLELAQRFTGAESAYKTAVSKDPKNESARVNYGLMLARQGRTAEATEQLGAVLTPAEVHYNLASVLESQEKIAAARAEYQTALRLDPDMTDARDRLAALDSN